MSNTTSSDARIYLSIRLLRIPLLSLKKTIHLGGIAKLKMATGIVALLKVQCGDLNY